MPTTLFTEVNFSVAKLVRDIEFGEIALPDIQRPFVWSNAQIRDLFDSMYKGFPIGYLLFWENESETGVRQVATNGAQHRARLLIVDGQQRLTSIYAVLKGVEVTRSDYTKGKIRIAFRPSDERFDVTSAAIDRDVEFIPDISILWHKDTQKNRFARQFIDSLRKRRPVSDEEEDRILEAIDRLMNLENYPFVAMELGSAVEEEQVADIFVRVNSKGTTLNQADFILTLMSVFWEEGRIDLENFCRDAVNPPPGIASSSNHFLEPEPSQLLRTSVAVGFKRARLANVYSLLRGKDLETREFSAENRDRNFEILKDAQAQVLNLTNWHEFFKAIMESGYRRNKEIVAEVGLLYAYAFYLIGKYERGVESYTLRRIIARWFFMTSLTSRYSGSTETMMEEDLRHIEDAQTADEYVQVLSGEINNVLTNDFWELGLPNSLEVSGARPPALLAYFASLNVRGAKAFFSKARVSEVMDAAVRAPKSALEKHHVFPRNYLKGLGIDRPRDVNQAANMALAEWNDNLNIGDEPPDEYYPKLAGRFLGDDLEEMLYWHALPPDWDKMEYREFLEARRVLMAKIIRDAYESLAD